MTRWDRVKARTAGGLKALRQMVWPHNPVRTWLQPLARFNFHDRIGDGTSSSTVMAPLNWIATTFPEAPPLLWRKQANGQEEPHHQHPLLRLLERPNDFHTGRLLWMATLVDWNVDGNAYWLKLRDRGGTVRQLWWVPHWLIEPRSDEKRRSVFITHYEYKPSWSDPVTIDPQDVVHFRYGLDGDDPRKGRSPLKSVLREVFTDEEAANFTASLLRNMGVPGIIVSPDTDLPISDEDAVAANDYVNANFTGEQRGAPMVMRGRTKVSQFGFSPEQLVLRDLRRIPEERTTAVLGVPAIVAGLGAGLDRSTFTNYTEAREAAYEQKIIPSQGLLAEEIRFQLLPDFERDPFQWRFGFDLSRVRVLQEDEDKKATRYAALVREGIATRADARRALGLDVVDDRDAMFLLPLNVVQVRAETLEPVTAPNNSNGNGDAAEAVRAALELEAAAS